MLEKEHLREQLEAALAECLRLREQNARLQEQLEKNAKKLPPYSNRPQPVLALEETGEINIPSKTQAGTNSFSTSSPVDDTSPPTAKVQFFRELFRARDDVYAVRFIGRDGKPGYCPDRERFPSTTQFFQSSVIPKSSGHKGKRKDDRKLKPLTNQVIVDHLQGRKVVGIYPLLEDETCWFLATDFDKETWHEDVLAFLETCSEWKLAAALERSRSGNGGHVWLFFSEPVPARLARQMGSAILTRTMERRHQLGLDSYDRFFPNQDTMPKGGFGNLIALPLQREPRNRGNSVFVDTQFNPYEDQWAYLSSLRRISLADVAAIVQRAEQEGAILGIRRSETGDDAFENSDEPWMLPPSRKRKDKLIIGPFPEKVQVIQSNLVYIPKEGLPSALLNRLLRIAAFQNPEFYRAQAMRFPVYAKPRVIHCGEESAKHIALPRGCLAEAVELLQHHGITVEVRDERFSGKPIEITFHGELRSDQKPAMDGLLPHDIGILSATTAFGKTVIGAGLIAARKVNTLVLVHRRQLMDQWRERLSTFLNLPLKSIGLLGGGRDRLTGQIDIAIIQSLYQDKQVKDCVADYGQIIVDECHHLGAFSFEQVLRCAKARYVVGLTATPIRKDGHQPIIMMQCGPIRYRVDAKEQAALRNFDHVVIPKMTNFRLPLELSEPDIQTIYSLLTTDLARNRMIVSDVVKALSAGRSPILLTERTEHLNFLATLLQPHVLHLLILKGGMGSKQRKALANQLANIPADEPRILLATGRYAGEGFDDARLDTLFLVSPISWRGTLQQYVGRLHRLYEGKQEVQVYDYVDVHVPMLVRMYERRLKGYRSIGYSIKDCANGCAVDYPIGGTSSAAS